MEMSDFYVQLFGVFGYFFMANSYFNKEKKILLKVKMIFLFRIIQKKIIHRRYFNKKVLKIKILKRKKMSKIIINFLI